MCAELRRQDPRRSANRQERAMVGESVEQLWSHFLKTYFEGSFGGEKSNSEENKIFGLGNLRKVKYCLKPTE